MNQIVKRLVVGGLILLLLALLLVDLTVSGATQPQRRRSKARVRGAEQVGDLFKSNCARCHGAEGRSDTPLGRTFNAPDLTDQKWWQEHAAMTNSRSLAAIITNGKGSMPGFSKKLNRSEINMLVAYVRRFRNRSDPTNSQ